jgi:hypothetical protein
LQQPLRQQLPDTGGQTAEEQAANQQRSGLTAPPTGEVNELSAPPTGEANPLTAPATGEVNELSASPTGRPAPSPALTTGRRGGPAGAGLGTTAPGIVAPIGPLTIDQSGTGRLQQVVEGVQVADVVGMAVVIYTDAVPPANTIPPGGNTVDAPVPGQRTAAKPPVGTAGALPGPMPVAAGLIRISGGPADDRPARATEQNETGASARGARQSRSQ